MGQELTIEEYLHNLRHASDPDERRNAAWWLGRQRDIRIVEPLIVALDDPDASVRVRATESLGNLRDERAVLPLITRLSDDDASVRAQACHALGRQGDYRALPALIEMLRDGESQVRAAAAGALAKLPDASAAGPLVSVMIGDEADYVRHDAQRSLSEIGGEVIVSLLLIALNGDHEPDAMRRMVEVLAALGDSRATAPLQGLVDHPDEVVRATVAWALNVLQHG